MIKEFVVYESNGKRFNTYEEAYEYDVLCDRVNTIMNALPERTKEVEIGETYINHKDINVVKNTFKEFIKICREVLPYEHLNKSFDNTIKAGHPVCNSAAYYINDCDYPILSNTYYRFCCINFESGNEYNQSYYVNHESEFFRERNLSVD